MDCDRGCIKVAIIRAQHEPAVALSLGGIMAFERLDALRIDKGTSRGGFIGVRLPLPRESVLVLLYFCLV